MEHQEAVNNRWELSPSDLDATEFLKFSSLCEMVTL